jgi:hypothetical protein
MRAPNGRDHDHRMPGWPPGQQCEREYANHVPVTSVDAMAIHNHTGLPQFPTGWPLDASTEPAHSPAVERTGSARRIAAAEALAQDQDASGVRLVVGSTVKTFFARFNPWR